MRSRILYGPPDINGVSDSFRIWGKRPALFLRGYIYFGATHQEVYDLVCEWEEAAAQKYAHMRDIPKLRHKLPGAAGKGELHAIKAIVKRARDVFGGGESVFAAARKGAASRYVGCGAATPPACSGQWVESDFASSAGEFLKSHHAQFETCKFLISDEARMAGRVDFRL